MSKITNLEDKNNNIVYPITVTDAVVMSDKTTKVEDAINSRAKINVTDTDVGEGATLASGEFMAVYGEGGQVQTADIANSAVNTAKIANNAVTTAKIGADIALIDADGTVETEDPWIGTSMVLWQQFLNRIYPVGSIYISTTLSTTSAVASALGGGTWVAWGAGRVPVGVDAEQTEFDTAEETGGEKAHTLSVSEIPSHTHGYSSGRWAWAERDGGGDIICKQEGTSYMFSRTTTGTGGGNSHNNLQPYITCYMYKRTA